MPRDDFEEDGVKHFDVSGIDREQVRGSLADIPYQSLAHLARNTGLGCDVVLKALGDLEMKGIVREREVGTVTAYYLTANEPEGRLYLAGGSRFLVSEENKKEDMPT